MFARRIVTVLATLLAVPGLGATSASAATTTDNRRSQPAAMVRAADTKAPVKRVGTAVRNVPSAFPLPPGSRVTDLADRESGASFTLTEPDPETVLSFYRRELPRAFTVLADRAETGATSLAFRDAQGWAGAIYATARRVTVSVKRI
ncbi:hypothetical protein JIG36_05100 [Actinoplanes sp. LDG1-06]|uniref:Secreted protein n=1 Tax=Paractinoplanes ovalisporus TaxID=2810368 RepID=A0ABS2A517_9ACTN|nr:hypothetical protein [Actinoplanes ovalisporus]MBM2614935.1 hypothetical protein [Actinoplanes ovalisporus]